MLCDPRIIVALDLPCAHDALRMVDVLGRKASFYKIGLELLYGSGREGLELVSQLKAMGKRVFLDAKLHDIPNTVERACAGLARLEPDFLTVHAYPQTLKAAAKGFFGSKTKVLGVTVLTSCDDADLRAAGHSMGVRDLVCLRAQATLEAGCAGVIAAPGDLAALFERFGKNLLYVTPGIRPRGAAHGDQKRVFAPKEALEAGADYLVIGRPITAAEDPRAALDEILLTIG